MERHFFSFCFLAERQFRKMDKSLEFNVNPSLIKQKPENGIKGSRLKSSNSSKKAPIVPKQLTKSGSTKLKESMSSEENDNEDDKEQMYHFLKEKLGMEKKLPEPELEELLDMIDYVDSEFLQEITPKDFTMDEKIVRYLKIRALLACVQNTVHDIDKKFTTTFTICENLPEFGSIDAKKYAQLVSKVLKDNHSISTKIEHVENSSDYILHMYYGPPQQSKLDRLLEDAKTQLTEH